MRKKKKKKKKKKISELIPSLWFLISHFDVEFHGI